MKKRLLAAFLWFMTGWYAGAVLTELVSASFGLAPVIGAAAAAFIFADPLHVIWRDRVKAPASIHEGVPEPA
jgi:hypothetical protein